MLADGDERRRCDDIALVFGEVDAHAVGILSIEHVPHVLEVLERPAGEAVTFGCDEVDLVELREILPIAATNLDAFLGGLADVAAPLLIHALLDFLGRLLCAILVTQRQLEVELWLTGGEPFAGLLRAPAALLQIAQEPGGVVGGDVRGDVGELLDRVVGDGVLDCVRLPHAVCEGGTDADGEGLVLLGVRDDGIEMLREIVSREIQDRSLGEISEVALDLRDLPVEHEADAGERLPVIEADALATPFGLRLRPSGRLKERRGTTLGDEVEMGTVTDGANLNRHPANLPGERAAGGLAWQPSAVLAPSSCLCKGKRALMRPRLGLPNLRA